MPCRSWIFLPIRPWCGKRSAMLLREKIVLDSPGTRAHRRSSAEYVVWIPFYGAGCQGAPPLTLVMAASVCSFSGSGSLLSQGWGRVFGGAWGSGTVRDRPERGDGPDGPGWRVQWWTRKKRDFGFVHTVEQLCGAEQVYTPPRWPNANADVEAVYWLIEEEFFEPELRRSERLPREDNRVPALLQLRAAQQLQRWQDALGPGDTRPPRPITGRSGVAPRSAGNGIREGAARGLGFAWA
jgi:hypothetical protein